MASYNWLNGWEPYFSSYPLASLDFDYSIGGFGYLSAGYFPYSFPYFPYTLDYDLSKMGLNSYPKARLTNASIKGSNIIKSTKTTAKTPSVVFTTESDELKSELENVQALPESSSSISLETESILNRPESKTKFRSVSQQTSILFTDLLTTSVIEASAPTIPFTVSTTSELIEASNFTTETVGSATTLNEEDSDSHIPDTCSDDD